MTTSGGAGRRQLLAAIDAAFDATHRRLDLAPDSSVWLPGDLGAELVNMCCQMGLSRGPIARPDGVCLPRTGRRIGGNYRVRTSASGRLSLPAPYAYRTR